MLEKIKNTRWEYWIPCGIIFAVGLCFLFFAKSLTALTVTVGIILSLCGLSVGSLCILSQERSFAFVLRITLAVFLFISGVLVMAFNKAAFGVLVCSICLLLIVDASFKLYISIRAKTNSVSGWWIMTAISAAVILSAFLLASISPGSAKASAIWLGITMLADSADNFVSIIWSARCKTAEKAAIYYEVYNSIESSKR